MTDLALRKDGACGRITLTRPQALNALSWDMCLRIEAALDRWRTDPQVALVLIEGEGPRAFCAGGDVVDGAVADTGYRNDQLCCHTRSVATPGVQAVDNTATARVILPISVCCLCL